MRKFGQERVDELKAAIKFAEKDNEGMLRDIKNGKTHVTITYPDSCGGGTHKLDSLGKCMSENRKCMEKWKEEIKDTEQYLDKQKNPKKYAKIEKERLKAIPSEFCMRIKTELSKDFSVEVNDKNRVEIQELAFRAGFGWMSDFPNKKTNKDKKIKILEFDTLFNIFNVTNRNVTNIISIEDAKKLFLVIESTGKFVKQKTEGIRRKTAKIKSYTKKIV